MTELESCFQRWVVSVSRLGMMADPHSTPLAYSPPVKHDHHSQNLFGLVVMFSKTAHYYLGRAPRYHIR